jgi:hypothetical protein
MKKLKGKELRRPCELTSRRAKRKTKRRKMKIQIRSRFLRW